MTPSARVLVPIAITSAMVKAGTSIAVVDASTGEVAWAGGTAYTSGQRVNHSDSIWEAVAASTGVTPGTNETKWLRYGPSNRMAAFDDYTGTVASATTTLTFVLQAGFFNGLDLRKMEGDAYSITVKDAPGGTVIASQSGDLYEQAAGLYELLFTPLLKRDRVTMDSIPIAPNAEVTITITAASGNRVAIGSIKLGDWRLFIGAGEWGGTQYGASAGRHSYTYRENNADGTLKRIVNRGNRRDIRCSVVVPAEEAMYADAILGEVIDTAVVFEASNTPRYGYLSAIGFLSAEMTADNFGTTSIVITLKGNI